MIHISPILILFLEEREGGAGYACGHLWLWEETDIPFSPASEPSHLPFPQLEILCLFLPMARRDWSSGCVTIQRTSPTPWDGGRTQGPHPAEHVLGDFFQMTGLPSGP